MPTFCDADSPSYHALKESTQQLGITAVPHVSTCGLQGRIWLTRIRNFYRISARAEPAVFRTVAVRTNTPHGG